MSFPDLHPHLGCAITEIEQFDTEQPGEAWSAQLFQGSRELGSILRKGGDLRHEAGTLPTAQIG
jgi:hypothetical protein